MAQKRSIAEYYRILHIDESSSLDEVKKAYKFMVIAFHPDKYGSNSELKAQAEEKVKEINEAYEALKEHFKKNTTNDTGDSNKKQGQEKKETHSPKHSNEDEKEYDLNNLISDVHLDFSLSEIKTQTPKYAVVFTALFFVSPFIMLFLPSQQHSFWAWCGIFSLFSITGFVIYSVFTKMICPKCDAEISKIKPETTEFYSYYQCPTCSFNWKTESDKTKSIRALVTQYEGTKEDLLAATILFTFATIHGRAATLTDKVRAEHLADIKTKEIIRDIFGSSFHCTQKLLDKVMLNLAEDAAKESPDGIERIAKRLSKKLNNDQKLAVISIFRGIIWDDGRVTKVESDFFAVFRTALDVSEGGLFSSKCPKCKSPNIEKIDEKREGPFQKKEKSVEYINNKRHEYMKTVNYYLVTEKWTCQDCNVSYEEGPRRTSV